MTAVQIVSPSQIQSSLDKIWDAKENKNKMRASLFNIIFVTKKSPREEYIRKIGYKLIEKFPARIFFISSDPDSADDLKTAVGVLSTTQGEFDITCDLIEITASGNDEKKVAPLILPHIIPDLPIFLVWAEDPSKDFILGEELKQLATRIIFDSESTQDLGNFAQVVLQIQKKLSSEIADLNWARLENWRSLFSSIFADPEKMEKLRKASSMTITYNSQETPFFCHTKIQSIYLQAWIATRLKWKLLNYPPSLLFFNYEVDNRKIEVKLEEIKNNQLPPGVILSLNIQTTEGGHCIFSRDPKDLSQVCLEFSTTTQCALPTRIMIAKSESGQSLVKEICHKGTSDHYLEVLKLIASGSLAC